MIEMKNIKLITAAALSFSLISFSGKVLAEEGDYVNPGPIKNLQETHTDHQVKLTWEPAEHPDGGYTIYRDGVFFASTNETTYVDDSLNEQSSYQFSIYAVGPNSEAGEETKINVTTNKDITAPSNVVNIKYDTINKAAYITWNAPKERDFAGLALYDEDGEFITDVDAQDNEIYFYDLDRNTHYTFYGFSFDKSGNEQSEEDGVVFEFATTNDSIAPKEAIQTGASRVGENIVYSWKNPTDADFDAVKLTLPNGNKVVLDNGETSYTYKPTNFTTIQSVIIQSIDWNGNISKGSTMIWEDPSRPPVEAKNIKFKDVNGVITVTFTPANEYDYKQTEVTLPNGKRIFVPKGKSSFTYSDPTSVGKTYAFTFKSVDAVENKSKGIKATFTPKAITVNKTMTIKSNANMRTTPSATGKKMMVVQKSKKVYVYSKGYGTKREYSYIKYGTKKGYVLTSLLK
ncbi:fibronectin type III domain-containing protein [Gottfriedia luciferensis]|uniref:fibronectin type III domain-containing protein n=1 Tax=Gottfriedia luciferensis TaxID=178774 RepID=UPI000B43C562|nr:fibronectin type III domain-containing protein [Gottfriedia luciferensis]